MHGSRGNQNRSAGAGNNSNGPKKNRCWLMIARYRWGQAKYHPGPRKKPERQVKSPRR